MPVTDFLETPRFPEDISYGSAGGPGFKTFIFEGHSGVEQRSITWTRAKGRWDVGYGVRDKADMDIVRAFFYNAHGRAVGFRFKDWSDYSVTDMNTGTGTGALATFLLVKKYVTGANTYTRRIFKPIDGTLTIKVNSVTIPIGGGGSEVDIDYTTGTLVFGASVIPANGHAITWSGEFDVPVRFDTDQLEAAHEGFETETWGNIPLVELPLED